ncbi:hypothetical protein BDF19DRAFT_424791 [Syncephalis fuscata]|nr:hypothetical protein BDF19DRAFT_424791 [Syncephalis fuscata]
MTSKSITHGVQRTADYWRRYFLNKKLRALGQPTVPLEPQKPPAQKETTSTSNLPIISYRDDTQTKYELKYARSAITADRIMQTLSGNVFGFDAEWRIAWHGPQRPTALVQICDGQMVALLHLVHMEAFPDSLKEFLEDPRMLKTGVNVTGDATRLNKEFTLKTAGLVELGTNARHVMPELDSTARPTLARLTSDLLHKTLNKGPVRTSNWERMLLSPEQKEYAATDAYVSYKLYRVIEMRGAPMYTTIEEKKMKAEAAAAESKKAKDDKTIEKAASTLPVNTVLSSNITIEKVDEKVADTSYQANPLDSMVADINTLAIEKKELYSFTKKKRAPRSLTAEKTISTPFTAVGKDESDKELAEVLATTPKISDKEEEPKESITTQCKRRRNITDKEENTKEATVIDKNDDIKKSTEVLATAYTAVDKNEGDKESIAVKRGRRRNIVDKEENDKESTEVLTTAYTVADKKEDTKESDIVKRGRKHSRVDKEKDVKESIDVFTAASTVIDKEENVEESSTAKRRRKRKTAIGFEQTVNKSIPKDNVTDSQKTFKKSTTTDKQSKSTLKSTNDTTTTAAAAAATTTLNNENDNSNHMITTVTNKQKTCKAPFTNITQESTPVKRTRKSKKAVSSLTSITSASVSAC